MKKNKKSLGDYGEQLALREYLKEGFTLLEQQYRCPLGEIDLILKKGNMLYFVEVRTKTTLTYGTAEESITHKKKETIRKVSQYYIHHDQLYHYDLQFDVVSIFIDKVEKKAWLKRYPQAF